MLLVRVSVASFTDAWIETKRGTTTRDIGKSHLLQMRGLKQSSISVNIIDFRSHLLQMRGLKHLGLDREHHRHESHLLQMRGLKLINPEARKKALESHLLQMRGLKLPVALLKKSYASRIFYRCVD